MRLHLRLIAIAAAAAVLVGAVLALTVLDTNEGPNAPAPGTSSGTTGATGDTLNYAQAIPLPIDGPLLGVNLTSYTRDGYAKPTVKIAMKTLADLGSTAVTLVPTWYMKSANANRIGPVEEKSPSDESLIQAIEWAREAGLQVVVKPHVDVIDDTYRGEIQPRNHQIWFRSYARFIDHFADLASSNEADLFVVGTELKTMSSDTEGWRVIIQRVRDRFVGPVTYAANWDEVDQVQFWSDLDAIGVDAYYPLTPEDGTSPTVSSLVAAWNDIASGLEAMSAEWERPVILTEVGYPSQAGATTRPFEVTDQPADEAIQALAYRTTFKALSGSEWLRGISWWSWRADPHPDENLETDYTPEGKRAQGELAHGQWAFEG